MSKHSSLKKKKTGVSKQTAGYARARPRKHANRLARDVWWKAEAQRLGMTVDRAKIHHAILTAHMGSSASKPVHVHVTGSKMDPGTAVQKK